MSRWRAVPVAVAVLLLPAVTAAQNKEESETDTPEEGPSTLVYQVLLSDSSAAQVGKKAATLVRQAAKEQGWSARSSPKLKELLTQSSDDLKDAAERITAGRQLYQQGLEHYLYVRLDPAERVLQEAQVQFLAAAAAPPWNDLLNVHLYLGVSYLSDGDVAAAREELRRVFVLKPTYRPVRNAFPPSVLRELAAARASLSPSSAAMQIEGAPEGASVYVDGLPKGNASAPVVGLSEGAHYVWVVASGFTPWFGQTKISGTEDVTVRVRLEPISQSLSDALAQGAGGEGGAAIARIMGADRFALIEARSTVTGRNPFAVSARVYDGAGGKKIISERVNLPSDPVAINAKLKEMAVKLFAAGVSESGPSRATAGAIAEFFPAPGHAHFGLSYGYALANRYYDDSAKLVDATEAPFVYQQHRGMLQIRYGLRDSLAINLTIPYLYGQIKYDAWDCGAGNIQPAITRKASGLGDIRVQTDVRLKPLERGKLAVVLGRVDLKLPTGDDHVGSTSCRPGTLAANQQNFMLGTGQYDVGLSLMALAGFGPVRTTAELGYTLRLPGRVGYLTTSSQNRIPGLLDPGDEQLVRIMAAWYAKRWIAPEIGVEVFRRNQTEQSSGPDRTDFTAPAQQLVTVRGGAVVDFSERTQFYARLSYPVYGKNTRRYFPFDVTGPGAVLGARISF